jgi:Na+/H+ antiporter NhaC
MSGGKRRGASAWAVILPLLLLTPGLLAESVAPVGTEPREGAAAQTSPLRIEVEPPPIGVVGVRTRVEVRVTGEIPASGIRLEIREAGAERTLVGQGTVAQEGSAAIRFTPRRKGSGSYAVILRGPGGARAEFDLRTLPGWLTLVPPVLAILLALLFRQVVPALVAGVWAGAWIFFGGPFVALLRTIDHYVIQALVDPDHVAIIVFSLMLGGMVGLVSRSGGTMGLVEALTPYATDSRRGQLVTWLLGILVFFDDYANTLLVGNTMRPVTDRLRVSREKLAYIVDSTAAPVTAIALISTWIGYEVSLIGDSLKDLGSDLEAYSVFLQSIPYNFYPILALAFGLMVASSRRDFGPMLKAEKRAAGGRLLADDAAPLADFDGEALRPPEDRPRRWINAVLPVLVVLLVTFAGLWFTGREALANALDPAAGTPLFGLGFQGIGRVFGAGDSFKALLWGSLAGCLAAMLMATLQRILSLSAALQAWTNGVRSMVPAFVILTLAWSIAEVCSDLQTSGYMVASLSDHLAPGVLPAIVFVLAGLTAFATGTSWGTMGILIPLAVPTAYGVARAAGFDPDSAHVILLGTVSSVLAGAIFGDHCSPISDTTVMSSMSSGCDHVDHVRTQLPYAALVGLVAVALGYLPSGFGISPWICLVVAGAVLAGLLRWIGRSSST